MNAHYFLVVESEAEKGKELPPFSGRRCKPVLVVSKAERVWHTQMIVRLAAFCLLLVISFLLSSIFGLARPSRCNGSNSSGGIPNRTIYLRTEAATMDDHPTRVFDGVTLAECANRCTSGFQDVDCTAFEYESEKRRCALLQVDRLPLGSAVLRSPAVRDVGQRTSERAFFQSVCVPASISCPAPYAFERFPQHVLVGHAMEVVFAASVSDCLHICLNSTATTLTASNEVECRSAMYFYERGECVLNRETRRSAYASHLFTNDTRMQLVDYFENNCIDVSCGSSDDTIAPTLHWLSVERFSAPNALRELMVDNVSADECRRMCADNRVDAQPFPCRAYGYGRIGGDGRHRCRLSADGGLYDGGDTEAGHPTGTIDALLSAPPPSPFDDIGELIDRESSAEEATRPIPIMLSALAPFLLDGRKSSTDIPKFLPSSFASLKLLTLSGGGGGSEGGDETVKPPDGFTRQLSTFTVPSTERYYEKRCLPGNSISLDVFVRCTDASFEIVSGAMLNCRDMVLSTRSVAVCLATCLRMSSNCSSVNFNRKLDECVLNRRSRFSNPNLFRSGGNSLDLLSWDYYDNLCDYAGGTATPPATVFADAKPYTVNDNPPPPANNSMSEEKRVRIDGGHRHRPNYEQSVPSNGSNSANLLPNFSHSGTVNETFTIQTDCRRAGVDVRVQFHDAPSTGTLFVKERAATCAARFVATRHAYLRIRLERRSSDTSPAAPPKMSTECAGVETQPLVLSYMVVVQRVAMSESNNDTMELPSTFLLTGAERIFNVTCDFRGMFEEGPSTLDTSTATPVDKVTTIGVVNGKAEVTTVDDDLHWKGVKTVPKSSAIRFHNPNEDSIVSTTASVPPDKPVSSSAQPLSSLKGRTSIMDEAASGSIDDGTVEKLVNERITGTPLVHGQRIRMAVWRHDGGGGPARSVALGDTLDIRWTLASDSVHLKNSTRYSANTSMTAGYGFFVDNCTAERVGGHAPQPPPLPLFVNGCPDPRVYGQLVRSAILPTPNVSAAGAHEEVGATFTASIRAFRFDGSLRVRVRCSVIVCVEKCAPANCGRNLGGVTSFGRRRKRRQSSATIGELEELLHKYEEARSELARQHVVGDYEAKPSGGSAMITGSYTVTADDDDKAPLVPIEPVREFVTFSSREKRPSDEDNESISRTVDKSLRRISITKLSNSDVESSILLSEGGSREEPVHKKAPPPVIFRQRGTLLSADASPAAGQSTSLNSLATSGDEDSNLSIWSSANSEQPLVKAQRDAVCLRRSLFVVCLVVLAFLSTFQAVYLLQKCCRRCCSLCDDGADPTTTTNNSATSSSTASGSAEKKSSSLEKEEIDLGANGFVKLDQAQMKKPTILDEDNYAEIMPSYAGNCGRIGNNNKIDLGRSDTRKSIENTSKPYVELLARERGFPSGNCKERQVMVGDGYSTTMKNSEARKENGVSLHHQQFAQQKLQYDHNQQQQSFQKQKEKEQQTYFERQEHQQYARPQQQQQFTKKGQQDFVVPIELSHHRQPLFSSKRPPRDEEPYDEMLSWNEEGAFGGGSNDTLIVIQRHYPLSQFVSPTCDENMVADGAEKRYPGHCDRCMDEESGWNHDVEEPHRYGDEMELAQEPPSFIINAADPSRFYKISGDVAADDSTMTAGRHSNDQDDRSSFLSFSSVVERPLPATTITRESGATLKGFFQQPQQRQQQQKQHHQQQQQLLLQEDCREPLRRCGSRREGPYLSFHVSDSKNEDGNADELFNYFDDYGAPPNHENNVSGMPRVMPRTKFFTVGRTNNFGPYFSDKQLQRQRINNNNVVTTTRFESMRLWNKQQNQQQRFCSTNSQQQTERKMQQQQQTCDTMNQRRRRLTVAVDPAMLEPSQKHLSELV